MYWERNYLFIYTGIYVYTDIYIYNTYVIHVDGLHDINLGATPSFHRLLSRPVTPRDPSGISCGPLGNPWKLLVDAWGILGDSSGTAWGSLGELRGRLGIFWGRLGHPLGPLTRIFGHFRCLSGILWGHLGPPRGSHSLPKGVQEASWGALGIILEASKVFMKQFAAICKNLQIYCKVLQNSRSRETEIVPNQMLFCSKSSPNCWKS